MYGITPQRRRKITFLRMDWLWNTIGKQQVQPFSDFVHEFTPSILPPSYDINPKLMSSHY